MTAVTTHKVSLATGVGGAYEELDEDEWAEDGGVPYLWGRTSQFDAIRAGSFSLTLRNPTGKWTPGNVFSSLANPLTEGMGVCWQVNDRYVQGKIRSLELTFEERGNPDSARVRVTCDDMLGDAGRTAVDNFGEAIVRQASPYLWWRLDDPVGSTSAAESSDNHQAAATITSGSPTFGVASIAGIGMTQVALTDPAGTGAQISVSYLSLAAINYAPGGDLGYWGVWLTAGTENQTPRLILNYGRFSGAVTFTFGIEIVSSAPTAVFRVIGGAVITGPVVAPGSPHHYSIHMEQTTLAGTTTLYATPIFDGVAIGAATSVGSYVGAAASNSAATPTSLNISLGSLVLTPETGMVSNLALTKYPQAAQAYAVSGVTEGQRLSAIAATVRGLVLDTLPAGLSAARQGPARSTGSALTAIDDVMRTEQGHVAVRTVGPLLAPTSKVAVYPRDRGRAVDYTFDMSEIFGAPTFLRSLANTIVTSIAEGPVASASYTNKALEAVAGSATRSDTLTLQNASDLYSWAGDRVYRGINNQVPITSFTVDACSLTVDRWEDLLAIRGGHRIQITGLPSTQLGYSTWDGWVVGGQELADGVRHLFTFFVQPVFDIYKYGTARYQAGGELTLSAGISTTATSLTLATTGTKFTTAVGSFPVDVQIGSEQMTATACTGATPQVMTVVRGVNGTSAATHASGDHLELATPAIYTF